MTCKAEIHRAFTSYNAAFDYLVSRGFLCLPRGWENGRWFADIEPEGNRIRVAVRLRAA